MTSRKTLAFAPGLAVLMGFALSAASLVGEPGRRTELESRFRELDRNGDGKLTKDELAGRRFLAAMLEEADADGDGAVTIEEVDVRVAFPGREPARFEGLEACAVRVLDLDAAHPGGAGEKD